MSMDPRFAQTLAENAQRQQDALPSRMRARAEIDELRLQICLAAEQYLEARDELTAREDDYSELIDAGGGLAGDFDVADKALTAAEEREALAPARLRAKVAAW